MTKLYNTFSSISTSFDSLIHSFYPNISKNHLKILSPIIFGMISSESVVSSDIASFKGDFSFVKFDSTLKRIYRFLNNPRFDGYYFYDLAIKYVLSRFILKHKDKRIHISFDHMYVKNKFSIFMLSLRIGKQGIPLWFRCLKGFKSPTCRDIYNNDLIVEGINYVSNLFSSFDCNLIFLADRWFGTHPNILKHIDSIGHTYVIRTQYTVSTFHCVKWEKYPIYTNLANLRSYVFHSSLYYNIPVFKKNTIITNLAISKSISHKEPFYLLTNGDLKRAVKDYSYRFGSIENMFKNQKTNGFYLETTLTKNLPAFINLYSIVCFSTLFITILGVYYEKNKRLVFSKYNFKISSVRKRKDGSKVRYISLFNTGLTLFKLALYSTRPIPLSFSLKLYDI